MIAQIILDSELFIPRSEAVALGLSFTEIDASFGILRAGSQRVKRPSGRESFVDLLFQNPDTGNHHTKADFSSDTLGDYYILDRIPEEKLTYVLCEPEQLVDLTKFAPGCTVPYRIKRCVQAQDVSADNMTTVLYQLEQKIKTLSTLLDAKNSFNERCEVHMGGNTITTYNEVKLCEDCCTDALQTQLASGWRMIAVCVQKDQRRPDYILGRWNPNQELNTSAKRTNDKD